MSSTDRAIKIAARMISRVNYPDYDDDLDLAREVVEAVLEELAQPSDEEVERIARAYFESPCPDEELDYCNPSTHIWANAHPEDKEHHRRVVRFVLKAQHVVGEEG